MRQLWTTLSGKVQATTAIVDHTSAILYMSREKSLIFNVM